MKKRTRQSWKDRYFDAIIVILDGEISVVKTGKRISIRVKNFDSGEQLDSICGEDFEKSPLKKEGF